MMRESLTNALAKLTNERYRSVSWPFRYIMSKIAYLPDRKISTASLNLAFQCQPMVTLLVLTLLFVLFIQLGGHQTRSLEGTPQSGVVVIPEGI